ncbi:T9SS type A sorting domain-containing protein [candidate division KSB1 bacterium]|nr:T9SS type A sorting domain-containing protein [candidate division KSB1 bacterium]
MKIQNKLHKLLSRSGFLKKLLLFFLGSGFTFILMAQDSVSIKPVCQFGGYMASIAMPPGAGRCLYSGEGSGLGVWDVSDPAHPVFAGGLPLLATDVTDIQFDSTGQLAYLVNGAGLQIVSLVDSTRPVLVGTLATSNKAICVALVKPDPDVTYVVFGAGQSWPDGRLSVVDITDPAYPIEVGGVAIDGYPQSLSVVGSRIYVAVTGAGLEVYDMDAAGMLQKTGSYKTPGNAGQVRVVNSVAYVTVEFKGLYLLNVTNPANITLIATAEPGSNIRDVQVVGATAFTVEGNRGNFGVFDVTTPSAPVRIASITLGWFAGRIALHDGYAYVACAGNGLVSVDVTTPSQPKVAGSYERPSYMLSGAVTGTTGYIVDNSQLWICDYRDPFKPAILGKCELGHNNYSEPIPRVSVAGNTAVIAKQDFGMPIVNVADSRNPTLVGRFVIPAGAQATDVSLHGSVACLITRHGGPARLRLVDISHPANPTELGGLDLAGDARRLLVSGQLVFIADGAAGVRIINIATPATPKEVGHIQPPAGTEAEVIAVENHPTSGHPCLVIAFNADSTAQLQVYDILDPAAPVLLNASAFNTEKISDLLVDGELAYVAGSFYIVDWSTMGRLLGARWHEIASIRRFSIGSKTFILIYFRSYGLVLFELVTTTTNQVATITVTPATVNLNPGQQQQFTATGFDSAGNQVPASPKWSTTGGDIDSTKGLYTATQTGNFVVIATDISGVNGTATVSVTTSAVETLVSAPMEFALAQNFPNPFNPETSIEYVVKAPCHVLLKVYDVLGHELATLVDANRPAGHFKISLDASHFPTGLYFYSITMRDFYAVRKMVVMR